MNFSFKATLIYSIQILATLWAIRKSWHLKGRFYFTARAGLAILAIADLVYFFLVYISNSGTNSSSVFYFTTIPYALSFWVFTYCLFLLIHKSFKIRFAKIEVMTLVIIFSVFAFYFLLPLIAKMKVSELNYGILSHWGTVVSSFPLLIMAYLVIVYSESLPLGIWASSLMLLALLDWSIQLATIEKGDLSFSHYDVFWCLGILGACGSLRIMRESFSLRTLANRSLVRLIKSSTIGLIVFVIVLLTSALQSSAIEQVLIVSSLGFVASALLGLSLANKLRNALTELNANLQTSLNYAQEGQGVKARNNLPEEVTLTLEIASKAILKNERSRMLDEIQRAGRLKQIAAHVAHDIRSPLGALKIGAEF